MRRTQCAPNAGARLTRFTRRAALCGGASAALLIAASAGPALAAEPEIYSDWRGRAIRGTDPVAYFTEGRPVEGSDDFETDHEGYTYRFSSQANLDAFIAEPEAYLPQYGGYCAWAVAQGTTASTNPHNWSIVDGKLYLNYDDAVQARWEKDIPGNISKADTNWPRVLN